MLTLVTGAPGSGKTLWTMQEVERLRKETGRPVYYNGIKGITLSEWKEFPDEKFPEIHTVLPEGAICVVDEVYRLLPQGKAGDKKPEVVELFATHRHRGHDFYLLTQDRMSLHHFVRGLVGRHVHLERQFQMPRARLFEWQRLADPRDNFERRGATSSEFLYPKEVFGWYKSADLHTRTRKLPWARLALIPALLVVAAVALWSAFARFSGGGAEQGGAEVAAADGGKVKVVKLRDPAAEAKDWAAQWVERVPGQPHSAPFYDPTVKPVAMPKISGCSEIIIGNSYRCSCNTQQGTILTSITPQECSFYVRNGWFDPTKPDEPDPSEMQQVASAPTGSAVQPFASSAPAGADRSAGAPAAPSGF